MRRLFVSLLGVLVVLCAGNVAWGAEIRGGGGGGGSAQGLDANFALSGGNTITGVDESKKLEIRGTGGQATSGWNIYRHSSGKSVMKCVEAGVEGDCDVEVELGAGKHYRIKNSSSVTVAEVAESTGTYTEFSVDAEVAGNNITLYQKLCGGDLAAINPADGAASHVYNKDAVAGALVPTATASDGTNRGTAWLTFPDSDGEYGIQMTCELPPGWTGQLDAVMWGKTTGTGNFRTQIATKCYATDEADDAAFNTASVYTNAAGTSARFNRYAMTNITTTGCAANEKMYVRIMRQRTEASDTLNAAFDMERFELWARNIY